MPITRSPGLGVIARVLEAKGYKVGVIGQPDWKADADFQKLGAPRLFFGITAGSIDSMLVNYTPLKRKRAKDEHAPYRSEMPDRAVLVYANKVRASFPRRADRARAESKRRCAGSPITIIGRTRSGDRSSWIRGPISWFMGRASCRRSRSRGALTRAKTLAGVRGTCVVRRELPPEFEKSRPMKTSPSNPEAFCGAQNAFSNRRALAQKHAERYVLQYPMPGVYDRRPRLDLRPAFFAERPGPFPRVQDGPVLGRHPSGLSRPLLVLLPCAPPGRPDRLAERDIHPRRDRAPDPASRFQGIYRRPGRADGEHVRHGLRQRPRAARTPAWNADILDREPSRGSSP